MGILDMKTTRHTRFENVGAIWALLAVAPAVAASQGADDPVDLGTLVLRNQEDATGPVGTDKNPPTVTGSNIPVTVNEVPQSVSVLGREDIERFNASRVSETLRYTAGVTSDVFGNDTDYDWLRIRGFQADQTGIYLDNAQNLAFAFGSCYIDPYTLERIEIIRGPSSALYGGSNPGGLVNYVSKRPGDRVRELTFGINDAPAAWVEFDYGDALGNGSAYRVTGRIEGGDKYDDLNEGLRGTFAPSFKFETQGGTEITLLANIHRAEEKHNGSTFLPYFGTVKSTSEFGRIDLGSNFSDPDWDKYARRQASVSAIVERGFENGFTFTGIARLGVAEIDERYWFPSGYGALGANEPVDEDGTLNIFAFEHDTLVRTAQTDLRYYGTVQTGAVTHDLLLGIDARYYRHDEVQLFGSGSNSVENPSDPGAPELLFPLQDAETAQRQIGFYFQDQLRWGDGWIGTLNIRHDSVSTKRKGTNSFDREDDETSYRLALAREFDNGFTPYLSYSTFFTPLIDSPANGITEPETGDQIEAGFKWAPLDGNFALSAAAFRINRENVVSGAFGSQRQLGEVEVTGFEVEGEYDFANGLRLMGAATFLDAEITKDRQEDLEGNTPTLIPSRELSLLASYDFSGDFSGLTVGAGVRHRGESFADNTNDNTVNRSTIYDVFASYEIREGLNANLAVTNIADDRYVTACQDIRTCSYGSGREVSFSITSNW